MRHPQILTLLPLLACEPAPAPHDLESAASGTTSETSETTREKNGDSPTGEPEPTGSATPTYADREPADGFGGWSGEASGSEGTETTGGCPVCDGTLTRCDALDLACGLYGVAADDCAAVHADCSGGAGEAATCAGFVAAAVPRLADEAAVACACAFESCAAPFGRT